MVTLADAIETRAPKPPKPSGKVIIVRDTITLDRRNATYDYEGATLVWKGSGDCGQTENMPPIFRITGSGITVKNATIKGAPDGIHLSAPRITIQNIIFPDVCEDAITMKKGARWGRITGCYFAQAADKAIQCSYGSGHRVYENVFVNVKVSFRSKKSVNASFYRNRLYHCGSAVRADGRGSNTKTWDNTFIFVQHPYQPLDKAIIRQLGDDVQVK
ncbi:MAG: hypothetical protein ACI8XO_000152 [Verrucomicrobiales bacterium]|jgi:hypothetical protein